MRGNIHMHSVFCQDTWGMLKSMAHTGVLWDRVSRTRISSLLPFVKKRWFKLFASWKWDYFKRASNIGGDRTGAIYILKGHFGGEVTEWSRCLIHSQKVFLVQPPVNPASREGRLWQTIILADDPGGFQDARLQAPPPCTRSWHPLDVWHCMVEKGGHDG